MPKLVVISDTHGKHTQLGKLPEGDILIHCGDCTSDGGFVSLRNFLNWFEKQPHKHKIFVFGNHDSIGERQPALTRALIKELAPSCPHLQDSGCEFAGWKFFGSPVTPTFYNWAFNRDRGAPIRAHWDLIPNDTDVLITHGPPRGYGDWSPFGKENVGCEDLLDAIRRVKPKISCSGHTHFSGGTKMNLMHENGKSTIIVNASVVNENYIVVNKPVVIDL